MMPSATRCGSSVPSWPPGAAVAAVLVEHTWARTLEDAVSASAGTRVSSEFVNGASLAELAPLLLAAARHNRPGSPSSG
jgi:hypothetical protein